jgi:hypothetical protein
VQPEIIDSFKSALKIFILKVLTKEPVDPEVFSVTSVNLICNLNNMKQLKKYCVERFSLGQVVEKSRHYHSKKI